MEGIAYVNTLRNGSFKLFLGPETVLNDVHCTVFLYYKRGFENTLKVTINKI